MLYIHDPLPDVIPFKESFFPYLRPSEKLSDIEREWVTTCTMLHSVITPVYSPGFFAEWGRIVFLKTGKPVIFLCSEENQTKIEQAINDLYTCYFKCEVKKELDPFSTDFSEIGGVAIWRDGLEKPLAVLMPTLSLMAHNSEFYFVTTIN